MVRCLFVHEYAQGDEFIFLVEVPDSAAAMLGEDPEDRGKPAKMRRGLRWFRLDDVKDDLQVAKVLHALGGSKTPPASPWYEGRR